MNEKQIVRINFFLDQKHWATRFLYNVPRVGDELRFSGDLFFKVQRIVWPMDEEKNRHERCNIEIAEVDS